MKIYCDFNFQLFEIKNVHKMHKHKLCEKPVQKIRGMFFKGLFVLVTKFPFTSTTSTWSTAFRSLCHISNCHRSITTSSIVREQGKGYAMNTVENTMEVVEAVNVDVGKENLDSNGLASPKKMKISSPVKNVPEPAAEILYFAKLTENAFIPTKGSKVAAGYDLKSAYDITVPKRGSALVKTDIQIQLPHGTYGRVAPRSGLALKNKIDVGAGVIDEDYRGNVGVILFNHADEDFVISKGDRIAQLICSKIAYPDIVELPTLSESERGSAGFGSTGVKN